MAVKASATITLTSYRDTQSVTRYYKLRPAGSSAPLKPETKPPSSDWTDSEPACDISKELYFCDLTIFSNGEGEYSKVSKSTSYEAAKQAYNKAQSAKDSIDNLEIGGRNLITKIPDRVITDNGMTTEISDNIVHIYGTNTKTDTSYAVGSYAGKDNFFEPETTYTISTTEPLPSGVYLGVNSRTTSGISTSAGNNSYLYGDGNKKNLTFTTRSDIDGIFNGFFGILPTCGTVDVTFKIKLEKGNKATDWTPAPEDVDAGIDEAQGNALTAQEEASALDEDLKDFKSNEYSQINDKVGELVEYKGENEKEIGKIREELSQELVAQKFARIEPDKGSLILGEINGTTAVLTNEQFGFYTPNSEIAAAYFGKDNDAWAFNIERGIIKNDLRFSGFQWIARSNKNMSLKWLK